MLPIGARGGVRLIRRQACRVPRAVIAHTRRVSIKYPLPPSMVGASAWLIVKSPRMTRVGEGFGQVGSGSLPVALDHFRSPSASTTRQGPNTVLPQKGAVGWVGRILVAGNHHNAFPRWRASPSRPAALQHSARECQRSIELRARGVPELAAVPLCATSGELAAIGVVFDEL